MFSKSTVYSVFPYVFQFSHDYGEGIVQNFHRFWWTRT